MRSGILAAIVLSLGASAKVRAEDEEFEKLYQKVVKSCVYIVTPVEGGLATGSGTLIDVEKRLILTNWHVVDEAPRVSVQFPIYLKDGKIFRDKEKYMQKVLRNESTKGKVIATFKERDLAIIQLEKPAPDGTPALPLAKKSTTNGTTVWNIGNPGAVPHLFSCTKGTVRTVGMETMFVGGGGDAFQVRAKLVVASNPINPGDSGSALFDKRGYLIAVAQSGDFSVQNINNFIDVEEVRAFLKEKKINIKELSDEPDPAKPGEKDVVLPKNGKGTGTTVVEGNAKDQEAQKALDNAKKVSDVESIYKGRLQDVVKKYPGTKAAKEAQLLLSKLSM